MAEPSITLEQKVKTNRLMSKFIGAGSLARNETVAKGALAEVGEREEALRMLVESGLNAKKAFDVLNEALAEPAKGPPSWGDKIRAAQVVLDLVQLMLPRIDSPETSTTTSIKLENLSDEELKFYINFGHLPSPEDLARLRAVQGLKALPDTHTSLQIETTPTSE